MSGLFGNLFDLNGDGQMSAFESAVEFEVFEEMLHSDESIDGDDFEEDDFDDDF